MLYEYEEVEDSVLLNSNAVKDESKPCVSE